MRVRLASGRKPSSSFASPFRVTRQDLLDPGDAAAARVADQRAVSGRRPSSWSSSACGTAGSSFSPQAASDAARQQQPRRGPAAAEFHAAKHYAGAASSSHTISAVGAADSFRPPVGEPGRGDSARARRWRCSTGLGAGRWPRCLFAAVAGEPYLSLESVNPWIVVFSIGLFAALFATPFVLESRRRAPRVPTARSAGSGRCSLWGAVTLARCWSCRPDRPGDRFLQRLAVRLGRPGRRRARRVLVLGTLVVWMLSG